MDIEAVRGRLVAVVLAIVAKHLQHTKPVVAEQGLATRLLGRAVRGEPAPFLDRGLAFKE